MSALPWRAYGPWLRERFGRPVRKLTIDAGFGCPHREHGRGPGGCIYCNNGAFHPGDTDAPPPLADQLADGMAALIRQDPDAGILVYFQPYTNTLAPANVLRAVYETALAGPDVVGLAIGTRPDCLPDEVLDLLEDLAARTFIQLEIGLQSAQDETLEAIHRGHDAESFFDAMARSAGRGLHRTAHMIVGLPGETPSDAVRTAETIADAGAEGIKIHNLHIVRDTPLARQHAADPVPLLSLDAYAEAVADILEILPVEMVIERLHGSAPADWLVGPDWCRDGGKIREAIRREMLRRNTRQGSSRETAPESDRTS